MNIRKKNNSKENSTLDQTGITNKIRNIFTTFFFPHKRICFKTSLKHSHFIIIKTCVFIYKKVLKTTLYGASQTPE